MAAEVAQVLVRPGRTHLAVEPGLGMLAVPAHAEAVAVGGGGRFERALALHHQRVRGRGDVLLERDGFAAIGYPAAHGMAPDQAASIAARCGKAMARQPVTPGIWPLAPWDATARAESLPSGEGFRPVRAFSRCRSRKLLGLQRIGSRRRRTSDADACRN